MAASSSFTVGIIQEAVTSDAQANVDRAVERIREAADRGAQIVCLQELFNSPYFCKSQKCERFDLAEPIPGAPAIAQGQPLGPAIDRASAALRAFDAHAGALQPHFAYGALDKAAYTRAHLMHLANHWTEAAPA